MAGWSEKKKSGRRFYANGRVAGLRESQDCQRWRKMVCWWGLALCTSCVLGELNPHLQGFPLKFITEPQTHAEAGFWSKKQLKQGFGPPSSRSSKLAVI